MGWCNYIIIPRLKIIVEMSRYIDNDRVELFVEDFRKFIEKVEDFDYEILEKQFKEFSIKDLSELVALSDSASSTFSDFYDVQGLILFLNRYKIDYKIISEFNLKKERYKNYNFIRIP